jgi:NAD(P)-dependent dehydrogenase (short-subunit alcohol dehydrogenase family)
MAASSSGRRLSLPRLPLVRTTLAAGLLAASVVPLGAAPAAADHDAPCLESEVPDSERLADTHEKDNLAFERMHVDQAHEVATGRGVKIAVIDSGMVGIEGLDIAGATAIEGVDPNTRLSGHGTIVGGLIAGPRGVAPDAQVFDVKVYDTDDADTTQGERRLSSAGIAAGIDAVVGAHGRLDRMFNNAGVAICGEYDVVTLDDWDRIIDVNLRGVAHGSTLAYRQMVRQGGGRIVNTASVAGLVPVPLQAHYCATKHAVVGLSRTLAVEAVEHGVGVTVFCPAFVETGMFTNNTIRGSLAGADPRRLVPVRPLPAATAVARLLDGIDRGRELVITPFYGRAGWWLERLAPAAAMRLHRLTLRETRRRAATLR